MHIFGFGGIFLLFFINLDIIPKTSGTEDVTRSSLTVKLSGFICPTITDEHKHYADPQDCSRYYECHQGQAITYSCSPGFYFNKVNGLCDFPEDVECETTPKTSGTKEPITEITSLPVTTKSPGFRCPVISDEHKHYADPQDCTRYYECHQGQAIAYSCSPGFYFNEVNEVCDFPEYVQCKFTPKTSGTKVPITVTTSLPVPTKSPGFICPVTSDEHKHYADPQDCSRYYECHQGQAIAYSCSPGFYYNEVNGLCDFPEYVQCKLTPKTSGTKVPITVTTALPVPTKSPGFICPASSDEHKHYADPQDCSRYYECHQGQAIAYSCSPGFYFNKINGLCDFAENVQCGFVCPTTSVEHMHYVDPQDCSRYYECHQGQAVAYSCPPGFYYNKVNEICDFEENVQCANTPKTAGTKVPITETTRLPATTKSPGFICPATSDEHEHYADPQDCSRYYECDQGQAISYSCSPGFYFNKVNGLCDFAENVQCKITPGTRVPIIVTTPPLPVTTKSPGFICPATSDEHKHYEDPQDCSRYYECHQGQAIAYSCSPGFYFNKFNQICDFPENVQCKFTPQTSGTKVPTIVTTTPLPATTKSPGFICPAYSDEHNHYADPQDCSRYYECHQGHAIAYSCSPGFYFNEVNGLCDFWENVQCKLTPKTSDTKVPTKVTTTPLPATTKSPGFICPTISVEHKHYADPQDCSRYFECHQGQAIAYSCSPGFYFNEVNGLCDFWENVQCKLTPKTSGTKVPTIVTTTPLPATTKSPGFICPAISDEHKHYADPQDCSRYYECHQGQAIAYSCSPGFYFNEVNGLCDFWENVQCKLTPKTSGTRDPTIETTTPLPATTKSPGFICPSSSDEHKHYPDPQDCSRYYECHQGQAIAYSCSPGFYYNKVNGLCDFPENVQCNITPTSGTKTPSIVTTTPTSATTKSPGFICPSISDEHKHYPDPQDCSRYYECHQGQAIVYSCPAGFYFNKVNGLCDFAENVQCDLKPKTSGTKVSTIVTTTALPVTTKSPDFVCPPDSKSRKKYPDPLNCSRYYECNQGQKHLISCNEGYLFNVVVSECDFPENVKCSSNSSSTTAVPPTQNPSTRDSPRTEPPTTTSPPSTADGGTTPIGNPCIGKSDGTFLSHPDCSKFIECVGGKAIVFTCSRGTIWDEAALSCINNNNNKC